MKKWGDSLREEGLLRRPRYADVFNRVDRSDFIPEGYGKLADMDEPIPIPFGQTQSAPHIDGIFVDYVEPAENETALEVGTGSGYLSAILSFLVRRVVSVERIASLSKWASKNVSSLGRDNIDFIVGNINRICFKTRFDIIISTASFRTEPLFLKEMAKSGGRIIFPLGSFPPQRLIGYKGGKKEYLGDVAFVSIQD